MLYIFVAHANKENFLIYSIIQITVQISRQHLQYLFFFYYRLTCAVSVVLMHAQHKELTHVISLCCNLLHLQAFSANVSLMWVRGVRVSKHFDVDTNITQIIYMYMP